MGRTEVDLRGPADVPRRGRGRGRGGRILDRITVWDDAVRSRWPFSALIGPELHPDTVPGDGSRLLIRPAILGFIAVSAIVAGVSQQNSPFVLKQPGAWFFGVPSPTDTGAVHSTPDLFLGLVAVYGGLVLLARVWFSLARTLTQVPGVPVKRLALVLALWVIPLLVAPPLFSRDVYSYAAQGQMMSHHISPYLYGPGTLGIGSSYQQLVDPIWMNAPAPYGPLFLQIDGFLASASFHNVLGTVVLLRLLALVGVALLAFGIPRLARSFGRDPGEAFVLAILNPVTVLHFVGGAHNDALMLGLLVFGLALAREGRPVAGIVLCALAAAIKVPAAIGILYIGWNWMGAGVPLRERVRPLLTAALIGGLVMGALSVETGLGWGWIANLASPGTVTSWLAPATGLGIVLGHIVHVVGLGDPLRPLLSATRVLGLLGALVAGVVLLWRSDRIGMLRAMGITCLLVTVLGPVVQPWYLSWGLILLAPVATGKVRSLLITLSIASAFIGLPGGRNLAYDLLHTDPLTVAAALLACLFVLTVPLTPIGGRRKRLPWRGPVDGPDPTAPDGPGGDLGYVNA
jgi:alpha-1,6-mannosyltransferase